MERQKKLLAQKVYTIILLEIQSRPPEFWNVFASFSRGNTEAYRQSMLKNHHERYYKGQILESSIVEWF